MIQMDGQRHEKVMTHILKSFSFIFNELDTMYIIILIFHIKKF